MDPDFPPAMAELRVDSQGSSMNALLYLADGAGPHPSLVLLHGFPGNEKNLDLAQALRRAGFNVLFFHYRGSWGSAGDFGFGNAVQDVAAALAFLRTDVAATRYRVDPLRLGLVGHSMGGFAALKGAALDPDVGCVAAIAPWNLAVAARAFATGPDAEARGKGFAASVDRGGALRGMSGAAAVAEILDRRDDFDLTRLGPALGGRSVLLVAAERDGVLPPAEHFDPIATAYASESGIDLVQARLDGDHAFSWTRRALIRAVTDWATEHCASSSEVP